MALIHITNLKLRAVIGIFDWERECKQDIIINVRLEFDEGKSVESDDIKDTVDYKTITKNIISMVEDSEYFLIEKLADAVLNICLKSQKVQRATVKIDKPQALRFADSVSVELTKER